MEKFKIEITENLQKQIEIEAETNTDAAIIAKQRYRNGDIVLTTDDYVTTEIRAIPKSRNKDRGER